MSKQPLPSTEAIRIAGRFASDGSVEKCAAEIDALTEKCVKAEKERCAQIANRHRPAVAGWALDATEAIEREIRAPAERPAPEGQQPTVDEIVPAGTVWRHKKRGSTETAAVVDYTERARALGERYIDTSARLACGEPIDIFVRLVGPALSDVASERDAEITALKHDLERAQATASSEAEAHSALLAMLRTFAAGARC